MKTYMLEYIKNNKPITLKSLTSTFNINCTAFHSNKSEFLFMFFYSLDKKTKEYSAEISIYAKSRKYEHKLLAVLYVIEAFISYMSAKLTYCYHSPVVSIEDIHKKEAVKTWLKEIISYNKQIYSKLSFIDRIKTKIENYKINKTLKYLGE